MSVATYYDTECLEVEEEMTAMVEELQDEMQQYYTSNCEYLGEDVYFSVCTDFGETNHTGLFYMATTRRIFEGDFASTVVSTLAALFAATVIIN